jgi:hypothetical protein
MPKTFCLLLPPNQRRGIKTNSQHSSRADVERKGKSRENAKWEEIVLVVEVFINLLFTVRSPTKETSHPKHHMP